MLRRRLSSIADMYAPSRSRKPKAIRNYFPKVYGTFQTKAFSNMEHFRKELRWERLTGHSMSQFEKIAHFECIMISLLENGISCSKSDVFIALYETLGLLTKQFPSKVSSRHFAIIAEAHCNAGQFQAMVEIIETAYRSGLNTQPMIEVLSLELPFSWSLNFVELLENRGVSVPPMALARLVDFWGKRERNVEMLAKFAMSRGANSRLVCNSVIESASKQRNAGTALRWYGNLVSMGELPDSRTFGKVIKALTRGVVTGESELLELFMKNLIDVRYKPDPYDAWSIFNALESEGQFETYISWLRIVLTFENAEATIKKSKCFDYAFKTAVAQRNRPLCNELISNAVSLKTPVTAEMVCARAFLNGFELHPHYSRALMQACKLADVDLRVLDLKDIMAAAVYIQENEVTDRDDMVSLCFSNTPCFG